MRSSRIAYMYMIVCTAYRPTWYHRCKKTLTPRIKHVKNTFFMKKIKNVKKRWIKNVVDKLTKLIKPNEKFFSKITVLICMITSEGYGSSWENFVIAVMLNPSLKSRGGLECPKRPGKKSEAAPCNVISVLIAEVTFIHSFWGWVHIVSLP